MYIVLQLDAKAVELYVCINYIKFIKKKFLTINFLFIYFFYIIFALIIYLSVVNYIRAIGIVFVSIFVTYVEC